MRPLFQRLPLFFLSCLAIGVASLIFAAVVDYGRLLAVVPAAFFVGRLMLAIAIPTFLVYLVFALMREHEIWRSDTFDR